MVEDEHLEYGSYGEIEVEVEVDFGNTCDKMCPNTGSLHNSFFVGSSVLDLRCYLG